MLIETIYRHAARNPGKTALIAQGGPWTYAGFAGAIATAREFWARQGLRHGSFALLTMRSLPQAWVHGIALRSLGVATVPAPPHAPLSELRQPPVEALIDLEGELQPQDEALAQARGWRVLRAPRLRPETRPFSLPADAVPAGHMLMTSGTTGQYKLVLRDPVVEMRNLPLSSQYNAIDENTVAYVGNFPLATAGGYRWPLITWNEGGTVVFHQGADPLAAVLGNGVTHAYATAATLAQLLAAPDKGLPRRDGMSLMVTGGPLPLVLAEKAKARLTQQVYTVLASTEALNLSRNLVRSVDDLRWHRLFPQREVEVVDENDQPLPQGQVGRVRVRILDDVRGYWGEEELSREFFRDGWFYPGDLGEFDKEGRLGLHGRVTDVLNVLGNKIAPGVLEQSVQDGLKVRGVCAFTLTNAQGEEELHLAIEAPARPPEKALEEVVRQLRKNFDVVHLHVVAELPRNHMGKIQRQELRRRLTQA